MLLKNSILDELSNRASLCERLRMNYNLHESFDEPVQRMFNALEPGTNIPIARHLESSETLIVLRGKLQVQIFDTNKNIMEDVTIGAGTGNIGYHIPKGSWHKVISLEHGTVCFETREGPYRPLMEDDILK
jgi:cupin fold WbuC family metalloprotein